MKKLLLIDAFALMHRMFHALPPLYSPTGEPTGALYGVANTLITILKEEKPDYIAAAFDRKEEPTFRKELFDNYKAHRPKTDDELATQLDKARDLFSAFNISVVEFPGFEADDIIGTLAKKFSNDVFINIFTGDLDALQLVENEKITVTTFRKGIRDVVVYDEEKVMERFGIPPSKLVYWKALVGDKSDNIPGVPGIGAKTAEKILTEYDSLEDILKDKKDNPIAAKIKANNEIVVLSEKLSRIECNVPLKQGLKDMEWNGWEEEILFPLLERWGFESLIKRIGGIQRKSIQKSSTKKLSGNVAVSLFSKNEEIENKKIDSYDHIAHNWKEIWKKTALEGETIVIDKTYFDTMIAAWLINPDLKDYSWESVCRQYIRDESLSENSPIEKVAEAQRKKLEIFGLEKIFTEIEIPLIPILGSMELEGIRINQKKLEKLGMEIEKETIILREKIFSLAGETINLNSPQQISKLLFEKLNLGGKKKTKTGHTSTNENVLESLRNLHPIIPLLLEYRENSKIGGTYVAPLLTLGKENGGIIHTHFLQTGTATGRIASEKPNLQNLPQESKWSKKLRETFEAKKGYTFVSCDYSQIELRIIAHISKDQALREIFDQQRDVHNITAQKIFHKKIISPAERRIAKTLNFGVVYGMGSRLFAKEAGVTIEEAKRYINEYFLEFPGIKKWQEEEKKRVKERGYVENELGRKRWFAAERFFEIERAAINMPIQSLDADIMKSAMIKANALIQKERMPARIALVIHDELIFEVADAIVKEFIPQIVNCMEKAMHLSIPLRIETKTGKNLGVMENIPYEDNK